MNWQYHEVKPSPVLQEFIDCYWWEDYFDTLQEHKLHLVVPDNSIELIFTENPIRRKDISSLEESTQNSHLSGLKTKPQHCFLQKSPLMGVRFKPKGFYLLTDLKHSETIDQSLAPTNCFSKDIRLLEEHLFTTPDSYMRNQFLNDFFENIFLKNSNKRDLLFEKLAAEIETNLGMLPISEMAFKYNISIKTIERKLNEKLGITPKKYSKLVRIIHCLQNGPKNSNQSLTGLAYQYGFADQSHFIKEVKSITSVAPSTFLKMDHGIQSPTFS
ncbi:MAG: helix-turn-helix domain-containing protein [Saprospiraceae bacterium]